MLGRSAVFGGAGSVVVRGSRLAIEGRDGAGIVRRHGRAVFRSGGAVVVRGSRGGGGRGLWAVGGLARTAASREGRGQCGSQGDPRGTRKPRGLRHADGGRDMREMNDLGAEGTLRFVEIDVSAAAGAGQKSAGHGGKHIVIFVNS